MCFTIFNKIYKAYIVTFVVVGKVLKPGPNRTVRPGKPWTGHFYGLLNMKNRSMSKNSELYRPRSNRPVLWTMSSSGGSHGSFVSGLKRHRFGLSSLFFFPLPRCYFGLWNWIILSNKKPSPHSFNQETFDKYQPKFKIRLVWSLDCKTKISTKKNK